MPAGRKVLFPVRIEDRIQAERMVAAEQSGCQHRIDRLTNGHRHTVIKGQLRQQEALPGLVLLDHEEQRTFDGQLSFFPPLPCAPLHQNPRDLLAQRARILTLLNERFLPYLHGLRQPPVLHLLATHGGSYRIRVPMATSWANPSGTMFCAMKRRPSASHPCRNPTSKRPTGRTTWSTFSMDAATKFSPFCRDQFPVDQMRLWTCLATPLMHSDLVTKKVRLHFERASQGLCPGLGSWRCMPLRLSLAATNPLALSSMMANADEALKQRYV